MIWCVLYDFDFVGDDLQVLMGVQDDFIASVLPGDVDDDFSGKITLQDIG